MGGILGDSFPPHVGFWSLQYKHTQQVQFKCVCVHVHTYAHMHVYPHIIHVYICSKYNKEKETTNLRNLAWEEFEAG